MTRLTGLLMLGIAVVAQASLCYGADSAKAPPAISPFVAGFERFARHGEIDAIAAGRLLISELNCVACHASNDAGLQPKRGPRLERAGLMLQRRWIEQYLAQPHTAKPGTTMPHVLGRIDQQQRSAAIQSLADYLGSLQKPLWEVKGSGALPVPHEFWNRGDVDLGRELYHQVGCVACHEPNAQYAAAASSDSPIDKLIEQLDPDELEEMGLGAAARRVESIPHSELAKKYTRHGLTLFLLDPLQFRGGGRMPNLKLLPTEAADIAAYLLSNKSIKEQPQHVDDSKRVQQGREWFAKLNCNECHETSDKFVEHDFKRWSDLNPSSERGCLSTTSNPAIDYTLDDDQRAAIMAAIASANADLKSSTNDELQHTLLQMNCYACHERDGRGGVGRHRKAYFETLGSVDLGDEGRLPPPLTGVGAKLQPTWFKKVLRGEKADIRPHLQIRMPQFHPEIAEIIPPRMAQVDHASGKSETEVFGSTTDLAASGRQLMDVGCVQCHLFRGFSLPGVVGVELHGVTNRVRPEWFHAFILDPGSLKARTRMPTFFPDGKSQLPELLDGNIDRQVAAIWGYLKQLDKQPLPEKILEAKSQSYELKPTDRPIILRTFMPDAGTHAIAVGFPSGTHIAFDAERMWLATAWRGRFLDAQGTWFIRSAPPALPLADVAVTIQSVVPFASLDQEPITWPTSFENYRFGGYRLDSDGLPTFLYRYRDIEVEDTVVPDANGALRRTLVLTSPSRTRIWFAANQGDSIVSDSAESSTNDRGITVHVSGMRSDAAKIVRGENTTVWAVPVEVNGQTKLEVRYQW